MSSINAFDATLNSLDSQEELRENLSFKMNFVKLNKEQTRLQSSLNTKTDSKKKEISLFRCNDWTNPDDLTSNRVTLTFYP